MLVRIAEAVGIRILPLACCPQHVNFLQTKMENTMTRLSRISNNRALLVLSALGFLCASSGLVSAQGSTAQDRNRLTVDFDAKVGGKNTGRTNGAKTDSALPKAQQQHAGSGAAKSKGYIQGGTGAFATNGKTK